MKRLLPLVFIAMFCLASPRQDKGSDSPKQMLENTNWVLGAFAKWVEKLDTATESGKMMTYTKQECQDLAVLQVRARHLAADWRAVFDGFWDQQSEKEVVPPLDSSPKYERALVMAQEMLAITGATEAAIAGINHPKDSEAFALNVVDFVGIYRRMEQARQ